MKLWLRYQKTIIVLEQRYGKDPKQRFSTKKIVGKTQTTRKDSSSKDKLTSRKLAGPNSKYIYLFFRLQKL